MALHANSFCFLFWLTQTSLPFFPLRFYSVCHFFFCLSFLMLACFSVCLFPTFLPLFIRFVLFFNSLLYSLVPPPGFFLLLNLPVVSPQISLPASMILSLGFSQPLVFPSILTLTFSLNILLTSFSLNFHSRSNDYCSSTRYSSELINFRRNSHVRP